jgi:hypothetical protein
VDGGTIVEMCPDGATARCDITTDTIEMIQYWYYTDVDTLMTLEMNCGLMGGMWSVP